MCVSADARTLFYVHIASCIVCLADCRSLCHMNKHKRSMGRRLLQSEFSVPSGKKTMQCEPIKPPSSGENMIYVLPVEKIQLQKISVNVFVSVVAIQNL